MRGKASEEIGEKGKLVYGRMEVERKRRWWVRVGKEKGF